MKALDAKIAESESPYFDDMPEPQKKTDIAIYEEIKKRGIADQFDDEMLPNLKKWYENMEEVSQ